MNAAVTGGMVANIFTYGALGLTLIAEVFVAKSFGAGNRKEAAQPVWQMIWFSAATVLIFLPATYWGHWFVPVEQFHGQALDYFQSWMIFGPFFPLVGALSAFFIGIGRVKIIMLVTIIGNLFNVIADYFLVFGYNDVIPAMGARGAAFSTGVAQIIEASILFLFFFSSNNRKVFATLDMRFRPSLFRKCLNVGGPNALGHMIETAAWALTLRLMAIKGDAYVTTLAIGQNLHLLFAFLSQGLQKAVITIAANLMGQKNEHLMGKLIRSALVMLSMIAAALFIPLAIYPDPIVGVFLLDEFKSQSDLFEIARKTGVWVWIFIVADSLVWVQAGVLTAYHDTKFIMFTNAASAWCLAVMPTYYFVYHFDASPYYGWVVINFYGFSNALFFTWRAHYIRKRRNIVV